MVLALMRTNGDVVQGWGGRVLTLLFLIVSPAVTKSFQPCYRTNDRFVVLGARARIHDGPVLVPRTNTSKKARRTTSIRTRSAGLRWNHKAGLPAFLSLSSLSLSFSSVDDESYAPKKTNEGDPFLSSSFPSDTPAGLRGEAIRSALQQSKCIGWRNAGSRSTTRSTGRLQCGLVQVKGPGYATFLHNKLTQAFDVKGSQQSTSSEVSVSPSNTNVVGGTYQLSCLLTARGRLVDVLGVALLTSNEQVAYLITSPGHASHELFARLDPFVFPLDQVTLKDCGSTTDSSSSRSFTFAAVQASVLQRTFETLIQPYLPEQVRDSVTLPTNPNSVVWISLDDDKSDNNNPQPKTDEGSYLLITPALNQMPSCAAIAYTFHFVGTSLGSTIWEHVTNDQTLDGPVELGELEWETLRIEAGHSAYGHEFTAGGNRGKHKSIEPATSSASATPASPLELHLDSTIDAEKGCYLGQEGIASILKNPRGPPRLLYQVVFSDDSNHYSHDPNDDINEDDANPSASQESWSRIPRAGDSLYVLGSNQEILVGTVTSVAEPGGTGDAHTLGLALVRRADSILKQMNNMQLEIPAIMEATTPNVMPLDGLEVIVEDTGTVGVLRSVPSRRFRPNENMFVDDLSTSTSSDAPEEPAVSSYLTVVQDPEELARALEEAKKAEAAAEAAASEAKRKEEKLEMLRKRAEEAMARRRNKAQQ